MKLITLITTTFLALLTPTALAFDTSISEREDPYTQVNLSDNSTYTTIAEIELKSAWQNKYCANILSLNATRIVVDRWNCGTQQCTVYYSTDCSGTGYSFFDRPSDYAVSKWTLTAIYPWGSVWCQWGDSSSCQPKNASGVSTFATSVAASTPKGW
ncbi:uncharacterized protein N7458_011569 [Penicillium daleae]|uniref:Uncharacterized protein n=1 Tax=Penicillium daleae TaxID=63821 RepID=A0AAD6BTJ6_9EURO|nr:uncharacterized protein N7458_011569 [Penicillium daleae]KAJ5432413.1 hypothetical protein N7458_011569 [Penicillium daleae]